MPPLVALLITFTIWGAAPPIFKFALEGIPPFTLAFIRFFFAGLILIPIVKPHWQKITLRQFRDIVLGGFFGISINVGLFFVGLEYSQSINVHVIGSLGPLFAYFLSILILHEKPHPQIMKGMLVAIAGVLMIILLPLITKGQFFGTANKSIVLEIVGNLLFILSTLGGVFHAIFNKRVLKKVNTYVVTLIQFFVGAVTFLPFMINELQRGLFQHLSWNAGVGIIYGVIFSSAIAYLLFSYGMTKVSLQQMGMISYISPIVAVLVAIPLLHEYPSIYFVLGTCLVFTGIIISQQHPHYFNTQKKLHR